MASATDIAASGVERPSFAKIAAAGLRSAPVQPLSNPGGIIPKQIIQSLPKSNAKAVPLPRQIQSPSVTPQSLKLVQLAARNSKESGLVGVERPEALVHNAATSTAGGVDPLSTEGRLAPPASDDVSTQLSSTSESAKPPSVDGKSVASTFALDEKESLRPDDSASVKAAEEEEAFVAQHPTVAKPHVGAEDEMRAFRDQLREITSMEPAGLTSQAYVRDINSSQGVLYVPPQGPGVGSIPGSAAALEEAQNTAALAPDVKLLEALESPRDRIWVLKLEQDIFDFVKDAKEVSLNLPQCNAYHRMLAHKLADYYRLEHLVDDSASAVRLFKTPNCRIPPPLTGITTPSTAASTPPPTGPQLKILRRGDAGPAIANGSNLPSKTTSESGASGNEDENKPKMPATREEREARYEAARLRIMGSSKPSETAEVVPEREDSRSSSAAGKKKTKKQRSDSEDGFEARSAYSAYYTAPYGSNGLAHAPYGFQRPPEPAHVSTGAQVDAYHTGIASPYQQYAPQPPTEPLWPSGGFAPPGMDPQSWAYDVHQPYDLSGNFQQAMSLQRSGPQNPPASTSYAAVYPPSCYGAAQPAWLQQQPNQAQQNGQAFAVSYSNVPFPASNHVQELRPYQYGQLPSQAFPGRPSSSHEHPLPGSYKSKHFNPQSQSFVPGQQSLATRTFTPQGASNGTSAFAKPPPLQRQVSAQSQTSDYLLPHQLSAGPTPSNLPSQPLMHPLPQPVFPRQASPNLPLPPKPGTTPQRSIDQYSLSLNGLGVATTPSQSSIAKWGTPASLPAKPPPLAEPPDSTRHPQLPRQPSYGNPAAARNPGGNMPSFGSMPPMASMAGGYGMLSGAAAQIPRRS